MSGQNMISVQYTNVTGEMFLREVIGDGTFGETEFTLDHLVGNGSFINAFDGEAYMVSSSDVVKALFGHVQSLNEAHIADVLNKGAMSAEEFRNEMEAM